jgi:hypothetical protein
MEVACAIAPSFATHLALPFRIVVLQVSRGRQELDGESIDTVISGSQFEVNELKLAPNIGAAYPPNLSLGEHVDDFLALNRSPCRLEFSEARLGLHATLDRSVILLQDVV